MRRYKHFLWLHNRLVERHPFIAVPPLPEKQVQGRFQAAFVEKRRRGLEKFLNHIARHPILRSSNAFHHFLRTPDYKDWKEGKRIIEAEPSGAAAFLDRTAGPSSPFPLPPDPQERVDRFGKYCRAMDRNVHMLINIAEHATSRREGTNAV